jgi:hypothetical protein
MGNVDGRERTESVWRSPVVVAAVVAAVGGMLTAIVVAQLKPSEVPTAGSAAPATAAASVGTDSAASPAPVGTAEAAPVSGPPTVPAQAIGRWNGGIGIGYNGSKLPTEFTIAQVPVGQSVGDLTIDLTGDYGQCTYRTPLVDLGADFIEFTFTKIAGGPGCVATYPQAHMSFDGSGTAQIKLGSTTSGTLYRS